MEALDHRRSTREYADRELDVQALSDLLWAAFGVNRPSGDRTAPYWRHVMVIDVYAAMADGVWLTEPGAHSLLPYRSADLRGLTGGQDFVASAPLNLVYVAGGAMSDVPPTDRRLFASVDTGFIGQNVYLFCASEGLATGLRGAVDYPALENAMRSCPPSSLSPSLKRSATRRSSPRLAAIFQQARSEGGVAEWQVADDQKAPGGCVASEPCRLRVRQSNRSPGTTRDGFSTGSRAAV